MPAGGEGADEIGEACERRQRVGARGQASEGEVVVVRERRSDLATQLCSRAAAAATRRAASLAGAEARRGARAPLEVFDVRVDARALTVEAAQELDVAVVAAAAAAERRVPQRPSDLDEHRVGGRKEGKGETRDMRAFGGKRAATRRRRRRRRRR